MIAFFSTVLAILATIWYQVHVVDRENNEQKKLITIIINAMSIILKTTETKTIEFAVDRFPVYYKGKYIHLAIFSEKHGVQVCYVDPKFVRINCSDSPQHYYDSTMKECSADDFNNALHKAYQSLVPIEDKEVYHLEEAEDELHYNEKIGAEIKASVTMYEPPINLLLTSARI